MSEQDVGMPPPRATGDADEALLRDAWGALNFILAFYDPQQRYLDTNAWKQAEAGGRRCHALLSERLGIPMSMADGALLAEAASKAGWAAADGVGRAPRPAGSEGEARSTGTLP